jgi:branched-subunit amino acid aminotransferase/4-amino-4-deoxychorismate lyase
MPESRAGVFETLLAHRGQVVNADRHLDRLAGSVRELYDASLDLPAVRGQLLELASTGEGYLRIRLTFRPDLADVEWSAAELPERPVGPWHLVPFDMAGGLGRHKWVDRDSLDGLTGAPWTADTDPLLIDDGAQVLETGRGNLFVVVGDVVRTPRDDGRILPGVVRAQVLDLLRLRHIDAGEVDLVLNDLDTADEVFVTNSIGGVRSVVECVGIGGWRSGPVTEQVRYDVEAAWHPASGDRR